MNKEICTVPRHSTCCNTPSRYGNTICCGRIPVWLGYSPGTILRNATHWTHLTHIHTKYMLKLIHQARAQFLEVLHIYKYGNTAWGLGNTNLASAHTNTEPTSSCTPHMQARLHTHTHTHTHTQKHKHTHFKHSTCPVMAEIICGRTQSSVSLRRADTTNSKWYTKALGEQRTVDRVLTCVSPLLRTTVVLCSSLHLHTQIWILTQISSCTNSSQEHVINIETAGSHMQDITNFTRQTHILQSHVFHCSVRSANGTRNKQTSVCQHTHTRHTHNTKLAASTLFTLLQSVQYCTAFRHIALHSHVHHIWSLRAGWSANFLNKISQR